MNPRRQHAANLLGVSAYASLEEVKKSFREKAKALHPDTAASAKQADDEDTSFAELQEAYEILVKRAGEAEVDGVVSHGVYGPGMRARFEAARKWRERRREGAKSGAVKAAMENTNGDATEGGGRYNRDKDGFGFRYPNGEAAHGSTSTADDGETLQAILLRHKVARTQPSGWHRFASEMPFITRKTFGGSKIAGAAGAALLCTTSCLMYVLSTSPAGTLSL